MSATFRRGVGIGVGGGLVVAVALALVLALVPAGAQEGDTSGDTAKPESTEPDGSANPRGHEPLSDEDRACLEENGAQLPDIERDEDGRPVRPDPADRPEPGSEEFDQKRAEMQERHEAFRSAAEACGLEFPGREPLSDEDRACLEENGAQLPELDENGTPVRPDPSDRPEPGTEEFEQWRAEREAFAAAAEACGLEVGGFCGAGGPGHFGGPGRFGGGPGAGGLNEGAPAEGTSIGNAFLAA